MRVRLPLVAALCLWLLGATAGECLPCLVETGLPSIRHYAMPLTLSPDAWAIAQDADGVMYFGVSDRINEYDGATWRSVTADNGSVIRSLAAADGVIYVGGNAELGFLKRDREGDHQYFSLTSQIPEPERGFLNVWKTYVTGQGVYFQANERLFRWSGNRMTSWEPSTSFHFSYVVHDRFYILDRGRGLLEMVGGQLMPIPGGEIFRDSRIYTMLPLSDGKILIGTRSRGLYLYDGSKIARQASAGLGNSELYHGVVLSDGTLALATTDNGLLIIDQEGRLRQHLHRQNGFPDNNLTFLFVDRADVLWIASRAGITRVEVPSDFSLYDERLGIRGTGVLHFRAHDRTYLATGSGLYVSPPEESADCELRRIGEIGGLTFSMALVGDQLLAASGRGLFEVEGDRATRITEEVSLRIYPSRHQPGVVYVGLLNGLSVLQTDGERWIHEGRVKGADLQIDSIFETDRGDLWLGSAASGALHVQSPTREPRVTHYSIDDGLPRGRVEVTEFDSSPVFLTDRGIYIFDEAIRAFRPNGTLGQHFADGTTWVQVLFKDDRGRAWIAHGALGHEQDPDPAMLARLEVFSREDSAFSAKANAALKRLDGVGILDVTQDSGGALWIGTGGDGFQRFDPDQMKAYPALPVLIRKIVVADRLLPIAASLVPDIPYQENSLRIECALPDYEDESRNRFRYFLEGFDDTWSSWTAESSRLYTNLPEGDYVLHVEGRNARGQVSVAETGALRILPPWVRTGWAYLSYLAAVSLLLVVGNRLLVRHLTRRKSQLESLVRQRTHEVHQRTRELELSERHYRELVDHAHDVIFTANTHGRITSLNEAGKALLSAEEHLDSGIFFGSEAAQQMSAFLRDLLERRDPEETSPVLAEVELTRQDGETVLLETNTRFLRDGDRIVRIETIGRDITERRRIEERLRQAQKLEAVGELAGGVAHDFNNQLTAILGFSELLSADRPDDASLRKYVSRIREAGDQASRLTRKLLAVGRRQMLSPRLVRLNALLAPLEATLGRTLGRSIDIALDLESDLRAIRVDPEQIEQIVLELAANARDAMPGGGRFRIVTRNTTVTRSWPDPGSPPPGELVELAVSDNGAGMSEELRARIFEPFFTTKEFGHGAGLGLAGVYGIVRQSGGYLRVESREGAGTTFRLFFPIAEPVADVAKPGEPVGPAAVPSTGPELALVVDDDPGVRAIASRVLEEAQFRVLEASSAEEALEILERDAGIRLVLTDVTMPGMSGLELAARIRERDAAVRIVVMSGYSEELLEGRSAWEHKDAFVAKPFRIDEMLDVIHRVMAPRS